MAEQFELAANEFQMNKSGDMVSGAAGYTPTDEEKKAIKLVNSLYSKAKKHKKQYDEKWLDYYKMFRGRQWKEQRPSYRHSEVINMVFQSIQSSIPILTDAKPRFEYLPEEPSDKEFADIMSKLADADWTRNNWQDEFVETLYDSYFYGSGFSSMSFCKDLKQGIGGAKMRSEDPFYIFPDPAARDVNKDCNYFITAEPIELETIKAEYPDKAQFIKADLMDLMHGDKTDLDQVKFKSPTDNRMIYEGNSAYDTKDANKALKITCYLKSKEFEEHEVKQLGVDGKEVVKWVQKLKYPNGRKIVISGNGVLLEDVEIDNDTGLFFFSKLTNYVLPREFWGISEVEQIEGPQKIFNKLVSFSLDVLTLMGNPIWIVDTTANVDTDNLINRPGIIIEKNPNSEVRREAGVQLQPYVLQLIDRMKSWFDDISGSTEVSRGVNPTGITAASAIEALQQTAQQRLRLKSRHIDSYLQNLGQFYASIVMDNYTVPQIFRITNDQNAEKYFQFYVESPKDEEGNELRDEKGNAIKIAKYRDVDYAEDGSVVMSDEKAFQIRGKLDVRVVTGSSLPLLKARREELGFKLFQAGAIDTEELLKSVEWPNWETVMQRVLEKQQEQAALAAQQQPPPQ